MNDLLVTVFAVSTGEIRGTFKYSCEEGAEQAIIDNVISVYGAGTHAVALDAGDPKTQYVAILDEKPVVSDRSPLVVHTVDDRTTLVADGEDSIVLTGLPDPCEIIIDDPDPDIETDVITVSGGGFVFMAEDPGIYTIEVRRWPFLPFRIEFTAT